MITEAFSNEISSLYKETISCLVHCSLDFIYQLTQFREPSVQEHPVID